MLAKVRRRTFRRGRRALEPPVRRLSSRAAAGRRTRLVACTSLVRSWFAAARRTNRRRPASKPAPVDGELLWVGGGSLRQLAAVHERREALQRRRRQQQSVWCHCAPATAPARLLRLGGGRRRPAAVSSAMVTGGAERGFGELASPCRCSGRPAVCASVSVRCVVVVVVMCLATRRRLFHLRGAEPECSPCTLHKEVQQRRSCSIRERQPRARKRALLVLKAAAALKERRAYKFASGPQSTIRSTSVDSLSGAATTTAAALLVFGGGAPRQRRRAQTHTHKHSVEPLGETRTHKTTYANWANVLLWGERADLAIFDRID